MYSLHISQREQNPLTIDDNTVDWDERQNDNEDMLVLYGICKNYEGLVVRATSNPNPSRHTHTHTVVVFAPLLALLLLSEPDLTVRASCVRSFVVYC